MSRGESYPKPENVKPTEEQVKAFKVAMKKRTIRVCPACDERVYEDRGAHFCYRCCSRVTPKIKEIDPDD